MNAPQDLTSLMDSSIFAASGPPAVVTDAVKMLGFHTQRLIRVPNSRNGVDFSVLFQPQIDVPSRFLQGQERVVVHVSALCLQRLSKSQFRQPPGAERFLVLGYMNRPAYGSEIFEFIDTRVITVADLCHVLCQRVMIPFVQTGVMMQVIDAYGERLLVRVLRIGYMVEVQAYQLNDGSVLPRSYLVMSR